MEHPLDGSLATQIYLRLLRSVVVAYVEHGTSIIDRVYSSWFAVFLCRIWWTWLETFDEKDFPELRSMKNRSNSFITIPALFSIELNAHNLLSICLLVIQGDLPEAALSISKYDSQSCESTFRLTRSMSGAFSSIVNFTTEQFLRRAGKLVALTEIENESANDPLNNSLQFPKYHKRQRNHNAQRVATSGFTKSLLSHENIEKAIHLAFAHAYTLLSDLDVHVALKKKNQTTLQQGSSFAWIQFKRKSIKSSSDDTRKNSSKEESINSSDSDDGSSTESSESNSVGEDTSDTPSYDANSKSNFHGMRVFDSIPTALSNSYFSITIDGRRKYVHKQTACWLLTDSKTHLSSDRLERVQQSSN